jgi:serine/threonine-protein kinase
VTPQLETLTQHPAQPRVPAELCWFVLKGLAKNPAERYASVDEMVEELQRIQSGHIQVNCQRTLIKSVLHRLLRGVDQHPMAVIVGTTAVVSLILSAIVQALLRLF